MIENHVKRLLQRGDPVFGQGLVSPIGVSALRILAHARVDWLFVDLEHGASDMNDLLTDLQVADVLRLGSVVRAPDLQYHLIARCMDMGTLSIMVPRVETREQAEFAVQCVKFPPLGRRGMGSPAFLGFAAVPAPEAVRIGNEESMIVVQIESVTGVNNADAIASVPGVDVLFIGPLDLSISLGAPGDTSSAQWLAHADRTITAARAHGKAVGIVCSTADLRFWYDRGVRMFSVGTLLGHMRAGVEQARAEFSKQFGR